MKLNKSAYLYSKPLGYFQNNENTWKFTDKTWQHWSKSEKVSLNYQGRIDLQY